jgi:large subunit ribosomal protein L29
VRAEEIRELNAGEIQARIAELREEQFRLRFRSATETLEEPLRLRAVRRDIARLLTVLREKSSAPATATPAAAPAKRGTDKRSRSARTNG